MNEKIQPQSLHYESYFKLGLIGMAVTSLEKGWIKVNDKLCDIFGYPREELIKLTWTELTHPEDVEADVAQFERVLEGKIEGYSLEKRFIRKDRTVIHASISANCIRREDGSIDHFVAFVQDITRGKKAELKLHQMNEELEKRVEERTLELEFAFKEAEHANKAKTEFLSSMSHELRTPLHAILGFSQVLQMGKELNRKQESCVGEIQNAGQHLLSLIDDVLNLSSIESGKMELNLESVDILAVVDECLKLVTGQADRQNIVINSLVNSSIRVHVDRIRIKQVILNVLSNAIKYNRPNGQVYIQAVEGITGYLQILIRDTGRGISLDRLNDVFMPFNRLGMENSEIEGTGIGLTISKQILERMDSGISVESQLNIGSTFTIQLPLEKHTLDEQAKTDNTSVRSSNAIRTKNEVKQVVLYVEDNPASLKLVDAVLSSQHNISLMDANTPSLGIELALSYSPALILLDINLPGMNGFEVLEKLKNNQQLKSTPVIAVSANASEGDIEKAIDAGFSHYITKPFNVYEFLNVVEQYLQHPL